MEKRLLNYAPGNNRGQALDKVSLTPPHIPRPLPIL